MRVTPLDIRKQEFRKAMRGLDAEEVYAFLATVADEYEAVLSDNKKIREHLVELEERLKEYKAIETNLRNTLVTAEKLTVEAKENAKREAALIMREAEMEAQKSAEAIQAHTRQLRREIFELKKHKDNYITRLKALLQSHGKMVDGFEEDFAGVDQAIEKIGAQVEEDAKKGGAPPRMSRERITEQYGQPQTPQSQGQQAPPQQAPPQQKVTWGDDRRREDVERPVMPRPGFETREAPGPKGRPPEDSAPAASAGMRPMAQRQTPLAARQGEPQQGFHADPVGAVSEVRTPHQAAEESTQPPSDQQTAAEQTDMWESRETRRNVARTIEEKIYPDMNAGAPPAQGAAPRMSAPTAQAGPAMAGPAMAGPAAAVQQPPAAAAPDSWKQYDVRKEPTDWRNYQIPQDKLPQGGSPREADTEVETALSGLREAAGEHAEPRQDQQTPQGAAPQPNGQGAPPNGSGQAWSMDELRRNLSNMTRNEGN